MRVSLHLRPAIVLFGDSITQQGFGVDGNVGWASLLAAAYTRRADVLNRGFSGYNTQHALGLLPKLFGSAEPPSTTDNYNSEILFCTVFFGANDAVTAGEPQHVPIGQYADNLKTIIASIRKRCPSKFPIILMTPPPVDEVAWAAWSDTEVSDRPNQVARAYGERVKQVAVETECAMLDTWELLDGSSNERSEYSSDGLHFNEKGNRKVFDGLMELLTEQFPHLVPMDDGDGEGTAGQSGIPMEEKSWSELCGLA